MATLKIKDADGLDVYLNVIEAGTLAEPHQSVVPDYRIANSIRNIKASDGVDVSVYEKAKNLIKFGKNYDLDLSVRETIWATGGDETLKTANDIDVVVSSNAGDTQNIVIEGHTISGSDLTFVTQTATLNGTTNVTLTTPLARVSRLYNDDSTDFAGDITVEDNGTSTHLTVLGSAGSNQSEKCQTSLSSQDYWIITEISGGVVGTVSATVFFELQKKINGKVWRTVYEFNSSNQTDIKFNPPLIISPNSDVRIVGTSDTNNTEAVANIRGYLAIIT